MNSFLGASGQAEFYPSPDGDFSAMSRKIPGVSSAHFLKLVEERGTAGFWSCDLLTGQCSCSPGLLRVMGIDSPKHFSLVNLINQVHPEDRNLCEDIWPLIRSGVPVNRDFRIIRGDRTVRWVGLRSEVVLDADQRPARAVGLLNDISQLHENRQALDESLGRYRALVSTIAAMEWRATASGEPVFSHGWTALTGQPESEVVNGNWVNALHPDDRGSVIAAWRHAVATLAPYVTNHRIMKADGEYEWFHARAVPIIHKGSRPHEWLGMIIRHSDFIGTGKSENAGEATLTPMQIRAGRAMLQWTLEDLSRESGVSVSSIRRIEAEGERTTRPASLVAIRNAFEREGLIFSEDNAVSLRRRPVLQP
ncbi:PAS domain-containing protein [Rhizobium sp. WL3]|uniref:PAS domain-containing protein n=1 Tax=Rhizobium sp. WL3 TaxID=2603277 RepID=UPI001FEE5A5D|nr:PAS domain-containing protein [Rhizobium sp. WL3]